jgi:predicted dinucleotide-binding enzyme
MITGIIGAGQIGSTLTRRLRALGHELRVANSKGSATFASLAAKTGAVAVEAQIICAVSGHMGECRLSPTQQVGRACP